MASHFQEKVMHKLKDKPRFKAAAQMEKDFKSAYAKFLGELAAMAVQNGIKNVQLQSDPGVTPSN